MMSARQLAASLYGVWLLLRWDTSGFALFDRTFGGFCRSYLVAIALAPIHIGHAFAAYKPGEDGLPLAPYMFTEAVTYVLAWTVYPLVMIQVARILDREARYFDYMVAYNWFQLAVGLVSLPITVLTDAGLLGPEAAAFLNLAVLGAFFAYGSFLARCALAVGPLTSVGIVLLDVLLSLLVRQVVALV